MQSARSRRGYGRWPERLGVPRATVGNWGRRLRKVAQPVNGKAATAVAPSDTSALKGPAAELESENARLRREFTSLKLDNEILRKAARTS